jgi:hypothetical protein
LSGKARQRFDGTGVLQSFSFNILRTAAFLMLAKRTVMVARVRDRLHASLLVFVAINLA